LLHKPKIEVIGQSNKTSLWKVLLHLLDHTGPWSRGRAHNPENERRWLSPFCYAGLDL
jgi:hypothetical protein